MNKKAVAIVCAICIIGAVGYGMRDKFGKDHSDEPSLKKEEKTEDLKEYSDDHIALNDLKEIKADVLDANINIKRSEDNKFYMSYNFQGENGKDPLVYKTEGDNGDKLIIKDKRRDDPNKEGDFEKKDTKTEKTDKDKKDNADTNKDESTDKKEVKNNITIYVPEGAELKKTKIDLLSGKITVEDLHSKELKIKLSSGDVDLTRCLIKDSGVEVSDGNITSTESKFEGKTVLESSTGDLSAKFMKEDLDHMNINADTTAGVVKQNLGGSTSEDEYSSNSSYVWKAKDPKHSLEMYTVDGDISLDLVNKN